MNPWIVLEKLAIDLFPVFSSTPTRIGPGFTQNTRQYLKHAIGVDTTPSPQSVTPAKATSRSRGWARLDRRSSTGVVRSVTTTAVVLSPAFLADRWGERSATTAL